MVIGGKHHEPHADEKTPLIRIDFPASNNEDVCVSTERQLIRSYETDSASSICRKSFNENFSDSERNLNNGDETDFPVYQRTTESIEIKKVEVICCCAYWLSNSCRNLSTFVRQFHCRQWKVLIFLCLATLTSSLSVCLFPPFFPKLAESKGHSASVYGLIIGTNCLTAFIVSPFVAKNINTMGVNFAFISGMIGSGYCCALSGFLEYFAGGWKFVTLAVVIRIFQATLNAFILMSTMAFVAEEFPNSVAFLFSLTRSTMNLAQMVGPVIGGALHELGGFKMPFLVLGSFQMVIGIVCWIDMPHFRGTSKHGKNIDAKQKISFLLKIPGLWVSFLTFVFSTMSNGFLSITLEPKILRPFKMTPLMVGLLFGLKDGANCLASPIWGWMCERASALKILITLSTAMAATSFILLGPFPGLPLKHSVGIVVLALILNGFGVGGQQVSGVGSAMSDAVLSGYPDTPETHALITSLWSSLSGAGRFISRAGSGIVEDQIGFQNTAAIVTSLHLTILIVSSLFVCVFKSTTENKEAKPRIYNYHVHADSPSEPLATKSASVTVPMMTEDFEESLCLGSRSETRQSR